MTRHRKPRKRTFPLLPVLVALIAIGIVGVAAVALSVPSPVPSASGTPSPAPTATARPLAEQVLPPEGVALPGTWQNIGPKLVASGAIDLESFKALYAQSGRPLTEEQLAFLTEGSNEPIVLTPENAHFTLNVLWALGITNKNPILSNGPMGEYAAQGQANAFASTGGWPLGTRSGGELLDSAELIPLTAEQQAVVEQVAWNTYRPCCNNPTGFPDCNHGAAALALAELLASQGAAADEIAAAVKAANSLWFPQQYLALATYYKEVKGVEWQDADPWEVLSFERSSASGWSSTYQELQARDIVPEQLAGGGSCGA